MPILIRPYLKNKELFEAEIYLPDYKIRKRLVVKPEIYQHLDPALHIGACKRWAESKVLELIAAGKKSEQKIDATLEDNRRSTIADFFPKYDEKILASLEPTTREQYNRHYQIHINPAIGNTRLSELNEEALAGLVAKLKVKPCARQGRKNEGKDKRYAKKAKKLRPDKALSPKTVNSIMGIVYGMIETAYNWSYILRQPRKPKKLRETRGGKIDRDKYYDEDQLNAICKAAYRMGLQFYVLVLLCADSGLRIGEAAALSWEAVSFAEQKISVVDALVKVGKDNIIKEPKGNKLGIVNATPRLIRALEKLYSQRSDKTGVILYREETCDNSSGIRNPGPVTVAVVRGWIRRITSDASKINPNVKPNANPHKLRHSCATRIANETQSVIQVAEQLRHGSVNTSALYIHGENSKSIIGALESTGKDFMPAEGARLRIVKPAKKASEG